MPDDPLQQLQGEVEEFVSELFSRYIPNLQNQESRRAGKVIRDPIHGYHRLEPWEVEVLDSPLVQRLRYVHQNALAYLVYPGANHTRLDHSLGVMKVVRDLSYALGETSPGLVDPNKRDELRLAGLLHDVGHGIFSHLSESIIQARWYDNFQSIARSPPFQGKKPGEILSYLLITTKRFRSFFDDVMARHKHACDLDRIAGLVLGSVANSRMDLYQADMITGPLDADKLDYIRRDSYFTGIESEIDIGHIARSLTVWSKPKGGVGRTLIVRLSGATAVEQMHFARLALFPAMYHHQKVRALECMVRALLETLWLKATEVRNRRLRFERVTDFLRINESEFLALASREPVVRNKAQRILDRTLLRRALHISALVIKKPIPVEYSQLVKLDQEFPRDTQEIMRLRQEIFDALPPKAKRGFHGEPLDVSDVWLDIPQTPTVSRDFMRCYVDTGEDKPLRLIDLFRIDQWLSSYADSKWAGHVFGYPAEEHLIALNKAARDVLANEFRVTFLPRATLECKLPVAT